MGRKYINVVETAKLLRQALREALPGVKFGVRSSSYSGGASINVTWTDGPNTQQVEAVTNTFKGGYFDGMIDYKGSVYHKLDGEDVRFGADFIFTHRDYSDEAVARAIDRVTKRFGGCEAITVADYHKGNAWGWTNSGGCDMNRALSDQLARHSDRMFLGASPTCARVAAAGDDGYGMGTVGDGTPGNGGQGYPRVPVRAGT